MKTLGITESQFVTMALPRAHTRPRTPSHASHTHTYARYARTQAHALAPFGEKRNPPLGEARRWQRLYTTLEIYAKI